jgi:hypothetical protein
MLDEEGLWRAIASPRLIQWVIRGSCRVVLGRTHSVLVFL